jgi:SAM-dependent methyltransferase
LKQKKDYKILAYEYPKILMQIPDLIRIIYVTNYFTQLRKWYIIPVWKKLLEKSDANAIIIDFGAGEAQYIVPFCRKNSYKTFYAIDNKKSNINFCQSFNLPNLKTELLDIEKNKASLQADLGISVGVIQYLENDEIGLSNIYESLKPGAKFLLYQPINGKILLPIYKYVFNRFEQYESINSRKRIYTEIELIEKVQKAGFELEKKSYSYGFWGRMSHETLNTCLILIISGAIHLKIIGSICLTIMFPFIIIFMLLDIMSKKTDGNAILLELYKY